MQEYVDMFFSFANEHQWVYGGLAGGVMLIVFNLWCSSKTSKDSWEEVNSPAGQQKLVAKCQDLGLTMFTGYDEQGRQIRKMPKSCDSSGRVTYMDGTSEVRYGGGCGGDAPRRRKRPRPRQY